MKKIEVKDLKNIIDYLELSTKRNPKKIVFGEENFEITYDDFLSLTKKIATKLLKMNINKRPIAIFMNKNIQCLSVMFSSAMSNNYYTVIDSSTPTSRIDKIFSTLNPRLIITEEDTKEIVKDHYSNIDSINYDELLTEEIDEKLIKSYYDKMIDTALPGKFRKACEVWSHDESKMEKHHHSAFGGSTSYCGHTDGNWI